MRRRLIGVAAAGVAIAGTVLMTGTASAATWTIDPGGPFNASAGVTLLTIQETGVELTCDSSTAAGTLKSGSGQENPIGTLSDDGVQFQNCTGPFGLTFTVNHEGEWHLNAATYDAATGVTTGTLDDISAIITGPGCDATVSGSVNVTFTNSTEELRVVNDPTLLIERVSDVDTCLGLIEQGQHAIFDGLFTVTPGQEISSP
jgi:hypothetical protein